MQLTIDEAYLPVKLTAPAMSDEEFAEFCTLYPDHFIEMTAEGEIVIMPPNYSFTGSSEWGDLWAAERLGLRRPTWHCNRFFRRIPITQWGAVGLLRGMDVKEPPPGIKRRAPPQVLETLPRLCGGTPI